MNLRQAGCSGIEELRVGGELVAQLLVDCAATVSEGAGVSAQMLERFGVVGVRLALLAGKQQIFTLELLVLSDEVAQGAWSVLGDWRRAHVQLFREGASAAAFQRKSGLRRASLIEGKLGLEREASKCFPAKAALVSGS